MAEMVIRWKNAFQFIMYCIVHIEGERGIEQQHPLTKHNGVYGKCLHFDIITTSIKRGAHLQKHISHILYCAFQMKLIKLFVSSVLWIYLDFLFSS